MEKTREDFLISDSQFSALCVWGLCWVSPERAPHEVHGDNSHEFFGGNKQCRKRCNKSVKKCFSSNVLWKCMMAAMACASFLNAMCWKDWSRYILETLSEKSLTRQIRVATWTQSLSWELAGADFGRNFVQLGINDRPIFNGRPLTAWKPGW